MGDTGLFVSAALWERYGSEILRRAPRCEPILLHPGRRVEQDAVDRIAVAYLSSDVLQARLASNFMRVSLDAAGLRWFHSGSAGVDDPAFGRLVDRGVRLTTSSGAAAVPIAQTVMMYLLAMTRDLPGWLRDQAAHRWVPRRITDLEGRTLGVVGMGPIGTEVARLAQVFGMHVVGLRRTVMGDEPCETWTFDRLDELLGRTDDLVLAAPLTPETRHLLDAARLARMRPGAHLVNVGRGSLIDEPALVEALRAGRLGAAALDVVEVEPLPEDSELWDLPNVIITPHSSGTGEMLRHRATTIFLDNLERWTAGTPLANEVVAR